MLTHGGDVPAVVLNFFVPLRLDCVTASTGGPSVNVIGQA